MRKFLAVVKHEYKKIVYKWTFLLGTLLFPLIGACFAVIPAIIFSIKGEPTRIVIVDQSNKISPRVRENLSVDKIAAKAEQAAKDAIKDLNASQNERVKQSSKQMAEGFIFVNYDAAGKSPEQIRTELTAKAVADEIDAYLLVPGNIDAADAKFEFLSRKAGDFVAGDLLKDALNDAVRSQRLADANIDEKIVSSLGKRVNIDTKSIDETGREKNSDMLLAASFVIGLMIYITLAIYGQVIMGAVVEEKETRIAEILFSSARPFTLMLGKLVGVGLAGLTQMSIWIASVVALVGFLSMQADMSQIFAGLPNLTPLMIAYFLLFFLLGYFIYASFYALVGSMVTTVQEGGQFSLPVTMILLVGFYFCFAVIRDPNSNLSFWVSIAPFLAPLAMPVRIIAEMPPLWQIALSVALNLLAIAGLVWLASRVYRVGMLMYGKRATIPEVLKWIRQA
ncbi:MAG: ABC transporter permease [Chloracidobacterium sp.]|nr:ABC transporter permease [Chloracidobacterium sp.]